MSSFSTRYEAMDYVFIHGVPLEELRRFADAMKTTVENNDNYSVVTVKIGDVEMKLFT